MDLPASTAPGFLSSTPLATPTALLEALPWGVLVSDAQGIIQHLNQQAAAWCGTVADALVGRPLAEAPLPPALSTALQQVQPEAPPHEVWLATTQQWLGLRATRDSVGSRWVFWDNITARKQAETARQRSSQLLLDMEAVAHTGSYDADLTTGSFYFSAGMYRLFGEAPQAFEVTLAVIDARSHPADAATVRQVLEEAVRTRQPYTYRRRIRRADGAWRTLEAHGEVRCDAAGSAMQLRGLVQDITERVQAEQAREEARATVDHMLDGSISAICILSASRDARGRIVEFVFRGVNRAAEALNQKSRADTLGRGLLELFPGVRQTFFATYVQVVETGEPARFQEHYAHEHYNHWFDVSAVKHEDGFIMTFHDITALHTATEQLRASHELLRTTIDSSLDLVQVFEAVRDEQGAVMDFAWVLNNDAAERLYGDVIGQRLGERNPGVVPEGVFNTFKKVLETGVPDQTERHYVHEQFDSWFYQSTVKLGDGVATTTHDITERKRLEQELRNSHILLQDIIDAPNIGLAVYRAVRNEAGEIVDFTHEYINRASREMLGEDFTGRLFTDHGENGRLQLEQLSEALAAGRRNSYLREADLRGRPVWFAITNTPLDGDRLVHTWEDVTARQQAQQEILRLKEERAQHVTDKYHTLFTAIDEGFCLLERVSGSPVDFVYVEANDAFARQLGTSGVVGRTIRDVFPGAPEAGYALYEQVWQTGEPVHTELAVPSIGRILDVQAFRVDNGSVRQVAVVFSDITERKRREADAALLVAVTEGLNRLAGEEEILAAVGARLTQHFGLDCWHYVDVDEARAEVTVRHFWHAQAVPSIVGTYPLAGFLSPAAVVRMRGGAAAVVADVQAIIPSDSATGQALKAGAAAQQIAAYIAVPYSVGGQWKAYFALADSRPRPWTDAELALVQDVAARVFPRVERARAEAALRDSEERFRTVVNLVPDLLWRSALDSDTDWYNEQWYEYTGQTPETAAGYGWTDVIHPDDQAESARRYRAALTSGQLLRQEHRIRSAQGEYRWFQVQARALRNEHGAVTAWYGAATDIHARKLAELRLRESEEKYRTLFDSIDEGFALEELVYDANGEIADIIFREVNRAYERQVGLTNVLGKSIREVLPHLEQSWKDVYAQVARTGEPVRLINYAQDVDRWFDTYLTLLAGSNQYVAVVFNDITERKRREQEQEFLLKLSDALRPLTSPAGIQAAAAALLGEHLGVDRAYYVDLNYDTQEFIVARDWHWPGTPSHARRYPLGDWAMPWLLNGQTWVCRDVDTDPTLPDAQRTYYRGNDIRAAVVVPLLKQGRLAATLVVNQNAPHAWTLQQVALVEEAAERTWAAVERAKAEDALRISEEKYRQIFENIDQGFSLHELIVDESDQVIDLILSEVNEAFEQHTGLKNAQGKKASEIVPNLEQGWLDAMTRVYKEGEPQHFEAYNVDTNRWITSQYSRIGGAGSRLLSTVFTDITERKQREQDLALLADVSQELVRLTSVGKIMDALGATLGAYFGLSRCVFIEIDEARGVAHAASEWSRDGSAPMSGEYRFDEYLAPDLVQAYRAGETVVLGDVAADPRLDAYAPIGVHATVNVPLVRDGAWRFLLGFYAATPRDWRARDVELMRELTARIWTRVERARAEEALAASEQRLRALITNLPGAAAFMVGPDLRYQLAGGEALDAAGIGPADLLGRSVSEAMPPELVPQYEAHYRQALAGQGFAREHTAHGRTFISRGVPLLGTAGQPEAVLVVSYDITARKQAEEALRASQTQLAELNAQLEERVARRTHELRESRDLLHAITEALTFFVCAFQAVRDERGHIVDLEYIFVNSAAEQVADGRSLVGRRYSELFSEVESEILLPSYRRVIETGEQDDQELAYNDDTLTGWFRSNATKLGDGVLVIGEDITARKWAEQERLKNLRLLEQAEAVAGLGSWDYDLATDTMRWSDGMYQLVSIPLGQPVSPEVYLKLVVDDDRPRAEQLVRRLTAGQSAEETLRLQVGKHVKIVRLKAVVLRDEAGQPARLLGVDLDITELQRLEADNLRLRLGQQQAMFEAVQEAQEEERRRMSESLHNGIGQILYATKLQLDLLPTEAAFSPRHRAAELLGEAIRQTRTLSHELTPAILEAHGLEATLRSMCSSLSTPTLRWHCQLVFDEGPALSPSLQLAVYRLAQELAQNVLKHAKATDATLEVEVLPAWVVLRVEDNGQGFDPAQTSAGLGLRTLRSRAALLGGRMHVTTAPGQGTQCQIRLPLPL